MPHQTFPQSETINWSKMARKYSIPHKNGGQVLKQVANRRGIDVSRLDNRGNCTQQTRRKKKKLVGGEISTPCLPTTQKITEDKQQLIESGELLLGEPCTPYTATKSTVTSTGDIKLETIQIYGRKIPLQDLRKVLLTKHEKYMRINMPQESTCTDTIETCTIMA